MKISTDSIFRIGKGHSVCEDYALHFPGGIVVSDGCSSSPHTDVGARLLSFLAKNETLLANTLNIDNFGSIANQLKKISVDLYLFHEFFDATLLIALYIERLNQIRVITYGDGNIILKLKGEYGGKTLFRLINLSYPNGYPNYIAYKLNKERESEYLITEPKLEIYTRDSVLGEEYVLQKREMVDNEPQLFVFDADEYESILLTTDGIETFQHKFETTKPDYAKIAAQFLEFKQTKGEFIKRRINRVIKEYDKLGVHHYDDLAVAGIRIEQ